MYIPPLPQPPNVIELCNALKDTYNRMNERIAYENGKAARWQALRDRADPPGRVEWPLAPPDEMAQLQRVQAATGKLINEYEGEKSSREDYILELRAKLKRASETLGPMARHLSREIDRNAKRERKLEKSLERQAVVARGVQRSHEETCSVMGQAIISLKDKLKIASVDQQALADAKANAESLERGLPAAVEAATAQLRAELAETRRYVCELITDRDAAKKERDEAVPTAESTRQRLQDANEALRAAFNNACADRDAAKELLTQAQRQLMANRLPGAVLEENEKLRKLSSEACAERENLRAELVETKDRFGESQRARHEAVLARDSYAKSAGTYAAQLRRVDEWLTNWERGVTRARDVVKELCRLRGIAT
jgi:chromosome segregation ATPase